VTIGNHVTSIATDAFNYTISKVIWLTNTPPSGYSSVRGHIHYVPNTSYSELSNIKVYPSLNSIFEVGGIKYVPVSLSERTCDVIDCIYTGEANEVNIDKKVNYKGFDMTVRDINPYIFYSWKDYIKKVIKSVNIEKVNIDITGSIADNAFSDCVIESARIHKDVKELRNKVFEGCSALSTFIIEDRNTSLKIGSNGSDPFFKDCKLDSVYIGGKMDYNTSSSAGYSPFYNNKSLRTVKISDAETTIYDKEFYGCNNLKNVSFGKGLESIGADAFYDCVNVMQISCDAELPPSCSANLFDPINKWECKLIVPKNSIEAYKKADGWKEFFLIEGATTGIINNIYNKIENVDVYTIDGIKRLSKANVNEINALPKGVYIINGKKIVIK
jgi:cell surface protein